MAHSCGRAGGQAGRYLLPPSSSRSTARPSIHPINRLASQPDLVALPGERRREEKKNREKQKQSIAQTGGRAALLLPHRLYGTSEIGVIILKHQGRDGSVSNHGTSEGAKAAFLVVLH